MTPAVKGHRFQPDTSTGRERIISGQRVGYIRVSSLDQNTDRQLDGIQLDRLFTDRLSGKDLHRPQLEEMIGFVRAGDTVLVHSMDRLARNLDDLRSTVRTLTGRGVRVEFVKEQLTYTGDDTAMATLLLSVMGAFAEFERALLRDRQREGIALAKQRGAYRGHKPALSREQVARLIERAASGSAGKRCTSICGQQRGRGVWGEETGGVVGHRPGGGRGSCGDPGDCPGRARRYRGPGSGQPVGDGRAGRVVRSGCIEKAIWEMDFNSSGPTDQSWEGPDRAGGITAESGRIGSRAKPPVVVLSPRVRRSRRPVIVVGQGELF